MQTHHVDVSRKWYEDTPGGRRTTLFFRVLRPKARDLKESLDLLNRAHYWPDLNFIVYHSAYRGSGIFLSRGTGQPVRDRKTDDPQEIPWISDIFRILRRNPKIRNIYFELGSTFNQLSSSNPVRCLHMLGQMIQTAGVDVKARRNAIRADRLTRIRREYRQDPVYVSRSQDARKKQGCSERET